MCWNANPATGTAVDLSTDTDHALSLLYAMDTATRQAKSNFVATTGMLTLNAATADRAIGTVTGMTLDEIDPAGQAIDPNSCTQSVVTFSFNFGDGCPD